MIAGSIPRHGSPPRFSLSHCLCLPSCLLAAAVALADDARENAAFLSDRSAGIHLEYQQAWGDFGFDTAAARTGAAGAPLQIGQTKYEKGLGHHANGEIVVDLGGQFARFRSLVGVQWQGGKRGSVVFRVSVDGEVKFETGPMSDSDPPREIDLPLAGARQLRLTAGDAGDGIGCDMANWAQARLVRDAGAPVFETSVFTLGEKTLLPSVACAGFSLIAEAEGPQAALMAPAGMLTASVEKGEVVRWTIPVRNLVKPFEIVADVSARGGGGAEVEIALGSARMTKTISPGEEVTLAARSTTAAAAAEITLTTRGAGAETAVRWRRLRYAGGRGELPLPVRSPSIAEVIPPPVLPPLRPAIEQELIEWDWRMQDGIGAERQPRTWSEAIQAVLERGDRLLAHLSAAGGPRGEFAQLWEAARSRFLALSQEAGVGDAAWETLWRDVHLLRRRIALANPLAETGPLLFVKGVPSAFSHQLTQYRGWRARPGGGVFVLEAPGKSMQSRRLESLPTGSYMHADVAWDGRSVLFSFCQTEPNATDWSANESQYYHLFEVAADGSNLRQLTAGPFDDFAPRYLPDGKILFVSTRRGGFHRCGRGPCPVYTMAVAEPDGSNIRVISFHETHEWDPAVLNDGRVIYTRWDYVDRHAVHYQQLWSVRPDGSDVRAFYGNNTLNPVGVWEARPIPDSNRVMATAAAHHAMTAGSIILLDVAKGIDGLAPITRLTPDALFPESEFPVQHWHATAGVPVAPEVPPEEQRWPGHTYRSPYPLSEDFFLAAYSYDPLIGEPNANRANMFGIYLVDRFGNKELLYRDLSVCSLWAMPLRARRAPPALPSLLADGQPGEGTFFLHDVDQSWPQVSERRGTVKSLRIVQVLPKTTPHANTPKVGLANASPGKQVLGTVPVEADGSAYFRAPSGIPLAFQALDERGMAIQTMRSLTYLQPGEQTGCVGCHEHRTTTPPLGQATIAAARPPSTIAPGPDGSKPLSYPILVQPVLDKKCVECHRPGKAEGGIDLTGTPAGPFTQSYNALAPLVPFSEWKGTPQANSEPIAQPNQFGARASRLMRLLDEGHEGVVLSKEESDRLVTWMDANALFYGTFDPADQARQQLGQRIAGPALE